jgi:sugar phosphate isomerase/epimerase
MSTLAERIAVCSWSLQPATPEELAERLEQTGIRRVQIAMDPLLQSEPWRGAPALLRDKGITIVSGMLGCVGEDYSTLESIKVTGGVTPDATWEQNRRNAQAAASLARALGIKLVTFHAGFVPHEESDPLYRKMLGRLGEVADIFGACGITLGLETGQETAPVLREMLQRLGRKNLAINFDPANMILYDKGEPIEALRLLGSWIHQVHIKDAIRTKVPGTWGEEVPAGTGQVNWAAFFATLEQFKFSGDLVIEREAGTQRVTDIRTARQLIERIS